MRCKKEFEYKKAIVVDADMLIAFDEEIQKLCDIIHYKAELINKDELEFDSLDELVNYENSSSNHLKSITIRARDKRYVNDINIYIEGSNFDSPRFYQAVRAVISTDNVDKITVFQQGIEHLCDRHSQSKKYQLLSKTGIFSKIGYMSFGMLVTYSFGNYTHEKNANTVLMWIAFACAIYLLLLMPLKKIKRKYYPSVVFYLGDEIKKYDELKSRRNNFFWTVCIGGTLTIVFSVLGIYFSIR